MKKICLTVKALIFVLLGCLLVNRLGGYFSDKTCKEDFAPFFSLVNSVDVYFIGTSITHSGISPLDLYHDYGITSYNLATAGQTIPNNYWALKSAFNYMKPKLVVMDISYLWNKCQFEGQAEARLHEMLDNIPHNYIWIWAIYDLWKSDIIPTEQMINYIFPICAHHSRWDKLTASDFTDRAGNNYGATVSNISYGVDGQPFDMSLLKTEMQVLPSNEKMDFPSVNYLYIRRIVELCREENVEVLFVKYPSWCEGIVTHGDGRELQMMFNKFYDTAAELGVPYINGIQDYKKIGFVFSEDLRDYHHMNISGNMKITSFIGKYITEKYDLPDHRYDESFNEWMTEYQEYCVFRDSILD